MTYLKKRFSTLILRLAVILAGMLFLLISIFVFPVIPRDIAEAFPQIAYLRSPILFWMYLTVVPIFLELYQTWLLLNYVDEKIIYTEVTAKALVRIKSYTIASMILYVLGMPFIYIVAELDDAPGLIILGAAFIFIALTGWAIADVLQNIVIKKLEK